MTSRLSTRDGTATRGAVPGGAFADLVLSTGVRLTGRWTQDQEGRPVTEMAVRGIGTTHTLTYLGHLRPEVAVSLGALSAPAQEHPC